MSSISVDTCRLPLVDVAFRGAISEADCHQLFAALNEVCAPGVRVANVVDLRELDAFAVTGAIRQALARAFFDGVDQRRASTICEARIVTNALTRGILVAFDWVTGSKWPCASFTTREGAMAWVREQVEKDAGVRAMSSSGVFAMSPESGDPELLRAG
jgi:hypothetical protein